MPHVLAGATPCNNITGSNHGHSESGAGRDGFDGRDSKLFHDFVGLFHKLARIKEQGVATGAGAGAAAGAGAEVAGGGTGAGPWVAAAMRGGMRAGGGVGAAAEAGGGMGGMGPGAGTGAAAPVAVEPAPSACRVCGRCLHSSTLWLDLSASCVIGVHSGVV